MALNRPTCDEPDAPLLTLSVGKTYTIAVYVYFVVLEECTFGIPGC